MTDCFSSSESTLVQTRQCLSNALRSLRAWKILCLSFDKGRPSSRWHGSTHVTLNTGRIIKIKLFWPLPIPKGEGERKKTLNYVISLWPEIIWPQYIFSILLFSLTVHVWLQKEISSVLALLDSNHFAPSSHQYAWTPSWRTKPDCTVWKSRKMANTVTNDAVKIAP